MKKIQCGGFYVDDNAIETREGKPFLKTGGSDPIVENAKQTGGIGWTESGEQTVITWDGDTEGKISFVVGDNITIYKVSEVPQNYTPSALFNKLIVNGVEYDEIDSSDMTTQYGIIGYFPSAADRWQFYICVDSEKASAIGITETGVYFPKVENTYISLASYGTPDTIHKIDEKYLPEADGGVIIEIDNETGAPSIPKTEIDSLVGGGVMVYAKIENAIVPMVCDGVSGKMEFLGFVGASFSDDGKLNYADVFDATWDEATNSFIVNSGWFEFSA